MCWIIVNLRVLGSNYEFLPISPRNQFKTLKLIFKEINVGSRDELRERCM